MKRSVLLVILFWGLQSISLQGVAQEPERIPQPTTAELQKAEAILEEVFGKELRAAKTAAEKAKLAADLLQIAKDETDPANKLACLQQARQLAIAALDGPLGLEITREIVEAFAPLEEMTFEDRLAEADRVWQRAEQAQGIEKLTLQLQAAENYLHLLPQASSLAKIKIERRLSELAETVSSNKPNPSKTDPAMQAFNRMLKEASVPSREIKVLAAFFGVDKRFINVTGKLQITPTPKGILVQIPPDLPDPAFGVHKLTFVLYAHGGQLKVAVFDDIVRKIELP